MTSHYFSQYTSPGYTTSSSTSAAAAADTGNLHPLFEPDLVNSYAEALLIPSTVLRILLEDQGEAGSSEERSSEEKSSCGEKLRELSKSTFHEFSARAEEKCSGHSVRNFVRSAKIKLFARSICRTAEMFDVSLPEDWAGVLLNA